MGTQRVRYIVMTKPLHEVYNIPVPGLGRVKSLPPSINVQDVETLYFKESLTSCGSMQCGTALHPMDLEPWVVFEVTYTIEECARAVKRALFAVGEENIQVFQDIPASLHVRF